GAATCVENGPQQECRYRANLRTTKAQPTRQPRIPVTAYFSRADRRTAKADQRRARTSASRASGSRVALEHRVATTSDIVCRIEFRLGHLNRLKPPHRDMLAAPPRTAPELGYRLGHRTDRGEN